MSIRRLLYVSIIIVSIFTVVLFIIYTNSNHYAIWNTNKVYVSAGKSLNPKLVKIKFGMCARASNRKNDKDLFNTDRFTTIFENGKEKSKVINEYGENDFLLIYDDKYYFSFRHIKTNCNAQHDYHFQFYSGTGNEMFVRTRIEGIYSLVSNEKMMLIDSIK